MSLSHQADRLILRLAKINGFQLVNMLILQVFNLLRRTFFQRSNTFKIALFQPRFHQIYEFLDISLLSP